MRFVLDADVALEVDVAQGLEHAGHVEHALAIDHVRLPLVVVILEMNAEVARSHDVNFGGRVELLAKLCRANQVTGIEARTN